MRCIEEKEEGILTGTVQEIYRMYTDSTYYIVASFVSPTGTSMQ